MTRQPSLAIVGPPVARTGQGIGRRSPLAIVKNGLLLVGWSFYWRQVGSGALILLALAFSFGAQER